MLKICIIGAGNISNTRHIPAVKKNKGLSLIGVISDSGSKIQRTLSKTEIPNQLVINPEQSIVDQLNNCDWFTNSIDAVIIGAPPKQHFRLVKAALLCGKHVLVEKPMMMNREESDEVISLSKENNLILNVMHNFQFADGFQKLLKMLAKEDGGKIISVFETQYTNRQRRLPVWYNDLPLGLYYDEAAHFFYSAMKIGGPLIVHKSFAVKSPDGGNTPLYLSVQASAGNIPVNMYMNFSSPLCEWNISVFCENKLYIYDYFKDILIIEDNDQQHLAKDVLKTALQYTYHFWKGFILNGIKMATGRLLYGHDHVIESFRLAVNGGESDYFLSESVGRDVVIAMNDVVNKCEFGE